MITGPARACAQQADGSFKITVTPPGGLGFTASEIVLTPDQYFRFQRWLTTGGMIQQHLADLDDDQREILLSGIKPEEWDKAFGDDEDGE